MKDYYELVNQLAGNTAQSITVIPKRRQWVLVQALKATLMAPGISNLTRRSFVLMSLYAQLLKPYQKVDSILHILEKALTSKYYMHPKRKNYWWHLMHMAVNILQEQQITKLMVNPKLENKLIMYGFDHYDPKSCNNETTAKCFLAYSLWLFERAKVTEAIEFAKIAAKCNPNWGYPEYLVGWYNLFIGGTESLEYFQRAVAQNWTFLRKINKDRMCQRHKSLVKQLNNNLLVKKLS
jgi:hypothetical protein